MNRINLDTQISNFEKNRKSIISMIGQPAAVSLLGDSLFAVIIVSKDFLNNYLVPAISIAKQVVVNPDFFVGTMIIRLRVQLTVRFNFFKKNPSFFYSL